MKNVIEALLIVWPRGIPANEYERALSLAAKFGVLAPSLRNSEPVKPAVSTPPTAIGLSEPKALGRPGMAKVVAALQTGPATVKEVMEVTGLSYVGVSWAMKRIAKKVGVREQAKGTAPTVWAIKTEEK